jgi:uridylate kinase
MAKSSKIVCIDIGSAIYPEESSEIDLNAVSAISDQFVEISKLGHRVVAFVGPGAIGGRVLRIAKDCESHRSSYGRILSRASEASALLLIDCLLQRGLRVKSTPFGDIEELRRFALSSRTWEVLVAEQTSNGQSRRFATQVKARSLIVISEKKAPAKRHESMTVRTIPSSYQNLAGSL